MLPFGRVLVTGGAGFIGSHIVDHLIRGGCEVVVLDDLSSGILGNLRESLGSRNLEFVKGDINDTELVKKALKDVSVVFHHAGIVSIQRSVAEPAFTNHVNVGGTLNVLRCAADTKVDRFIFGSSSAVYGNSETLPTTEDVQPSPISPYGWAKVKSEAGCLEAHRITGLGTTILRYFNAYGPRSSTGQYSGVINKFAERLAAKQAPVIYGNGRQTRDFIHVADIVSANVMSASNRNAVGKVFNVGSGSHMTIEELAELEGRILLGDNAITPFDYRPALAGDVMHSYGDVSLIRKEIGFEPRFSIEAGLREYLLRRYPRSENRTNLKSRRNFASVANA